MLDRKIKSIDANEELLQDRRKLSDIGFVLFYLIGFFTLMGGVLVPFRWDEIVAGIGIGLMIIAGYFLIINLHTITLIYLKRQFERRK